MLFCRLSTVNGTAVRAYIDTGCSITVAEELRLTIHPTSLDIGGYAGCAACMTLTLDLITAEVEYSIQSIPIIVGQSFLNRAYVTLVLRNNQIRLFEKHLAELPEIDELPPRKIALWAKDTTILPPHTIGFIAISGSRDYTGEIYIEGVAGQELYREYRIPRCITTTDGAISVHKYANNTLEIKAGKLVASVCTSHRRSHPLQQPPFHRQTNW
jgi:hypothetical protein